MASRGGTFSSLRHVNLPSCGTSSSFSIKRILDLREDSAEKCASSSSSSSPAESCPSAFPLVPRVVRPIAHNPGDNVPCTGLMNRYDFGFMSCAHHWGCGTFPFMNHRFSNRYVNLKLVSRIIQSCYSSMSISCLRQHTETRTKWLSTFPFLFCSLATRIN